MTYELELFDVYFRYLYNSEENPCMLDCFSYMWLEWDKVCVALATVSKKT